MNAFKRALAIAAATLFAQSVSAALLSIAQYPLFLTHRTLPNVLVIYGQLRIDGRHDGGQADRGRRPDHSRQHRAWR